MNATCIDMILYAMDTLMYSVFGSPVLFFMITGIVVGLLLDRLGSGPAISAIISSTWVLVGLMSTNSWGAWGYPLIIIIVFAFAFVMINQTR